MAAEGKAATAMVHGLEDRQSIQEKAEAVLALQSMEFLSA